jgi:hypothetical protein
MVPHGRRDYRLLFICVINVNFGIFGARKIDIYFKLKSKLKLWAHATYILYLVCLKIFTRKISMKNKITPMIK